MRTTALTLVAAVLLAACSDASSPSAPASAQSHANRDVAADASMPRTMGKSAGPAFTLQTITSKNLVDQSVIDYVLEAPCLPGFKVTGGGVAQDAFNFGVKKSYPSPDGTKWLVVGVEKSAFEYVTVYAICIQ